jgi:hypothetical protein
MQQTHELPQALKDKIKAEVEISNKLQAEFQAVNQRLQDVIGAYILGAGLPQENVKFTESFDLLFDDDSPVPSLGRDMEEFVESAHGDMEKVKEPEVARKSTSGPVVR